MTALKVPVCDWKSSWADVCWSLQSWTILNNPNIHSISWVTHHHGSQQTKGKQTRSTTLKLMVHQGSIFKLWVRVRVRQNIFKQTWTNPAAHRDTFIWHLIFKSIVVINNLTWRWVLWLILETICSSDVAHLSFFSSLLIFNANSNKTITIIRRRGYVRNGVIRENDLDSRVVGLRGSAREDDLSGICSDQISHLLLRANSTHQSEFNHITNRKKRINFLHPSYKLNLRTFLAVSIAVSLSQP